MLAIDTTGTMRHAIDQAKAQATTLVTSQQAAFPSVNFAVVDFRDSGDTPEYAVRQDNTNNAASVQTAINGLVAGGGVDWL